ncbi:MAG: SDR family oxidoreductase [Roseburia sp.]|nr:SDR family oxidoreductase [Roseburia sp.]
MKYLIFGVNGMAGHMIAQYLIEQGHTVCGFARNKSSLPCETICGDARDKKAVSDALETQEFDYVINAVGILNRAVDRDLTTGIFINSVLPHFLAEYLREKRAKLIHISSDCVFEGTRGRYVEKDIPDAQSFYGRSKALGEVVDTENLTIRTSIVGPELKNNGIGLFHWFMSQEDAVEGYEKVIWSGVTTLQLAKTIAEDAQLPRTGLYHLVNNDFINKHDLLLLFNRYCRRTPITVTRNTDVCSDRTLLNTCGKDVFEVPSYERMVQEMSDWMDNHAHLYTQYRG